LLVMCGASAVAPVVASVLDPGSASRLGRSSLLLISWRSGSAPSGPAKATITTTSNPAPDLDVGAMAAAASPFYPPAAPTAPAALAAPVPAPPPPVAAPAGPPLPPPSNKATRRRRETGLASWYQIDNGTCAHKTLPKGTLVRVVNMANKKELICRVADRGPYLEGRVIDLDLEGFKQLADRSVGVIDVRINW